MNAKTKLHNAKLQEWSQHFRDQKSSGLNAKQWCSENQISYYAFNYWRNQLKEVVVDHAIPDIVPLPIPETFAQPITPTADSDSDLPVCTNRANCTNHTIADTVSLSINGLSLELDSSVPDAFLTKLIKAVRYA